MILHDLERLTDDGQRSLGLLGVVASRGHLPNTFDLFHNPRLASTDVPISLRQMPPFHFLIHSGNTACPVLIRDRTLLGVRNSRFSSRISRTVRSCMRG